MIASLQDDLDVVTGPGGFGSTWIYEVRDAADGRVIERGNRWTEAEADEAGLRARRRIRRARARKDAQRRPTGPAN